MSLSHRFKVGANGLVKDMDTFTRKWLPVFGGATICNSCTCLKWSVAAATRRTTTTATTTTSTIHSSTTQSKGVEHIPSFSSSPSHNLPHHADRASSSQRRHAGCHDNTCCSVHCDLVHSQQQSSYGARLCASHDLDGMRITDEQPQLPFIEYRVASTTHQPSSAWPSRSTSTTTSSLARAPYPCCTGSTSTTTASSRSRLQLFRIPLRRHRGLPHAALLAQRAGSVAQRAHQR